MQAVLSKYLKNPRTFFVSLMLILLSISACSSEGDALEDDGVIAPAPVGSEIYEQGKAVYDQQCAVCHGSNGEGQYPDAPLERDITGRFGAPPHNDTGHTWHHDDDLLIKITKEGGMGDPVNFHVMPALGSVLDDEQIEAVLAYIKTMWTEEQQQIQRETTIAVREQAS